MNDKVKKAIDDYNNTFMWMNPSQYEHVLEVAESKSDSPLIDSMSREDLYSVIESIEPGMKDIWFKQLSRISNKAASYYYFPRKLFPVGKDCEIVISCRYDFQKLVGKFKAVISPYYNYPYEYGVEYKPHTVTVVGAGKEILIPFVFPAEDRYILSLYEVDGDKETLFMTYSFYALDDDLFSLQPYKADLHMHTTFSDGVEPPELVVTSVRERGMDICAVTDHNNFQGSVEARKKASEMGLNLSVLLGEEYSLAYSPMHIVSIGTNEPVDRYYISHKLTEDERVKEIVDDASELSCDKVAYACTQVLLDEVNRMGGVTILAHPFWKPINPDGTRMDTPEKLFMELASHRKFTGLEIVSGAPVNDCDNANMQASLAQEILRNYDGIPFTGITDSHNYSTDLICGKHYTVIFSRSPEVEDVISALKQGMCMAVEIVGGRPMCYGSYRLAKLGHYLADFYFPERDEKAKVEGILAREKYLRNN